MSQSLDIPQDFTVRLPLELKHCILDHVSHGDVVASSSLSRSWYSAASSCRLYFIEAHLYIYRDSSTILIEKFLERLDYAQKRNIKIGYNLLAHAQLDSGTVARDQITRALKYLQENERLTAKIFILVPSWTSPLVFETLTSVAALALTEFTLKINCSNQPSESPIIAPSTLFRGTAHHVRTVCLHDVELPATNIPAFSNATRTELIYEDTDLSGTSLDIGKFFPRVQEAEIIHYRVTGFPQPIELRLDAAGALKRLRVVQYAYSFDIVGLGSLPCTDIDFHGFDLGDSDPFPEDYWDGLEDPLRITLHRDDNKPPRSIILVLVVSSPTRTVRLSGLPPPSVGAESWPWHSVPFARARELNLTQDVFHTLLWFTGTFSALHKLSIRIINSRKAVWPPLEYRRFEPGYVNAPDSVKKLDSPYLQNIVLERDLECPAAIGGVSTRDIIKLGRELGLTDSSKTKVQLTLRGLSWKTAPSSSSPIHDMFHIVIE